MLYSDKGAIQKEHNTSCIVSCLLHAHCFDSVFSVSSSQLPKVYRKPPKPPSTMIRTNSQASSASTAVSTSTDVDQSTVPQPTSKGLNSVNKPRWRSVRLPPLQDIFNGTMPMLNSKRYQRQIMHSTTARAHDAISSSSSASSIYNNNKNNSKKKKKPRSVQYEQFF